MYFPFSCTGYVYNVEKNPHRQQLLLNDLKEITNMSLESIVHKFNEGWRLVPPEVLEENHIRGDKVVPPIPFKDGTIIVR